MRAILCILALAAACAAHAAPGTATITWQPDPSWQVADGGTFLNLQVGATTAPRRIAIRFFANNAQGAEVWDDPARRSVNVSMDPGSATTVHVRAQAVAYECAPWRASTPVAAGEMVCVGEYPSVHYSMTVSTSGTTGAVEPSWPQKHGFSLSLLRTITDGGNATDNGDGTVGIPLSSTSSFVAGQTVTVSGTTSYNGTYVLPAQPDPAGSLVNITATYVAETFGVAGTVYLPGRVAVDNGNGTVSLPCPAHGFISGQAVTISGTTNYNGTYTLNAQTDPDWLSIAASFVAEQISGGYAIDPVVTDGTAVWTFTDAATPLTVLESDKCRRMIGRNNGVGQIIAAPATTILSPITIGTGGN